MLNKNFLVYYLSLTVFFASCFAVFHKSEHLDVDVVNSTSGLVNIVATDDEGASSGEDHSAIEGFCDTCLVLSYLNVALPAAFAPLALAMSGKFPPSYQTFSSKQVSLNYYSRAPPTVA